MVLTYACFALCYPKHCDLDAILTHMFIHVKVSKIINITNFVSSRLAVCKQQTSSVRN